MHHDTEFTVVFIACVTLALGAATRLIARRTSFPYTIAMLLLGLATGLALKAMGPDGPGMDVLGVLTSGANITPHLIIFAFLPALVFESAFALDVYAFRKNIGAVTLLAVPALIIATVATGGLVVGVTTLSWGWDFATAVVFGVLISATDPVAVVAILRDLGAPKRLGVLIEGESLLNDGTAIVLFNVLVALIATAGATLDVADTAFEFVKVVSGGIAVGAILALVSSQVVARTFNDATTEITITIVLAYACMIVAEGILHVSGVMAVVVAGLWMGGPGRTRISPEVEHFLHEFWEMLSYIANTLIFYLVGLVIARTIHTATAIDIVCIFLVYAGVMALRFVVTFGFRPLIGAVGDPISTGEATSMSWGGLRGAVSLALALIVAQDERIAADVRQQMLLMTAGVVFLTIAINGYTMGGLLRKLGFDKPPLTVQVAQLSARAEVLDGVRTKIEEVSQRRDLRTVSWDEVHRDLDKRREQIDADVERAKRELGSVSPEERALGYWRQSLSMERQSYWGAFGKGTLGAQAVALLDNEIEMQLERLDAGDSTPPMTRLPDIAGLAGLTTRWRKSKGGFGRLEFDRLTLIYDVSRAESVAAESVLAWLDKFKGIDPKTQETIEGTYRQYQRGGKERLEDLRSNLPEISQAIETRLAKRIQLNLERDGYKSFKKTGAMDDAQASVALDEVEKEMKLLRQRPIKVDLPETADLCAKTPLFSALDEQAIANLADITLEEVVSPGQFLFHEGDAGDAMYIVARGAAHVIKESGDEDVVLDVLGGGTIVGEMSLLTDAPRTAGLKAATMLTVGKIVRSDFEDLMSSYPKVRERIWQAFATRRFDNYTRTHPRYHHLERDERQRWIEGRPLSTLADGEALDRDDAAFAFVVLGGLATGGKTFAAPELVSLADTASYAANGETRVVLLPGLEQALAQDDASA